MEEKVKSAYKPFIRKYKKKGKQKKIKCDFCSRTYWEGLWEINRYKNHFCSNECKKSYKPVNVRELITYICKNELCKKTFQSKSKKAKFCSVPCADEFRTNVYKMKLKMISDTKERTIKKINDEDENIRRKLTIRRNI